MGTAAADSVSQDDLAQMMVGRPVVQSIDKEEGTFRAAVLSLVGLTLQETGDRAALSDCRLRFAPGNLWYRRN